MHVVFKDSRLGLPQERWRCYTSGSGEGKVSKERFGRRKDWEKGELVVRRVGCQQARRTTVEHAHFGLPADVEIAWPLGRRMADRMLTV